MEWISIKDKLPEFYLDEKYNEEWHEKYRQTFFSENILVYCQHAQGGWWEVDYACYEKHYDDKTKTWDKPYFRGISNPIFNVTHWMPLPEPPRNNSKSLDI